MKLVHSFLEESAAQTPDKTALVCGEQRLTYAQIDAMANRLAQALLANGVGRGDRVLLFLPNSVELVVGIFATLKANAVFVPVNHSTKVDKLQFLAQDCRAAGIVTWQRQTQTAVSLQQSIPSLNTVVIVGDAPDGCLSFAAVQADYEAERPSCHTIDQDLACLIYTSGSTGEPKGVMSAHNNVVFAASSIISYLQNQPDDIVLNLLPLSFDYGLYQLLMTFKFGGTLVLERSFAYPAQIFKRIAAEKVTGFPLVPTIAAILLQMDLSSYDFSSLRYITNTAAALSPSHITALKEKFPQATLFSMYGLTETKRTLYLPPEQLAKRPNSVGIPIPGTEAWVEDVETGKRLGPGEIGELVIRGSHVMRGYWEKPEKTAERFRPGSIPGERLCYSGDLFRVDNEGFFYFVGRKDDIIKSRGEKVAPKEIENVLFSLDGVVETAVIGIPDPVLGEAIKAFIVPKDDTLSEKDVLRHCRQHLEDFMVPQQIEFRDALPKSSNGKIAKKELH